RARALVMTMMLGREGSDLVRQLAGQVSGAGVPRTAYWGDLVTTSIPRSFLGPLTDQLKRSFIRQFVAKGGASFIGKALPFGVGAIIGGAGNRILGKRVVHSSRLAFGQPPVGFREELDPRVRIVDLESPTRRIPGITRLSLTGLSGRLSPRRRMQDAPVPAGPAGGPASGPGPAPAPVPGPGPGPV
ncbi:MAG TPA: hypothetical protein VLO31_06460, partial [Cryobacterium sp.]|nr:hypothetical protein [Cryobacterium sp.]